MIYFKVNFNLSVSKVKGFAILIAASILFISAQATGQCRFSNPVKTGDAPDPHVIYKDGYYYGCYTTDSDVRIYRSETLQDIFQGDSRVVFSGKPNIWAPEIHYLEGKWYIYTTYNTGNFWFNTIVLEGTTQNPLDDFTLKSTFSSLSNTIDASVWKDPSDGQIYMAYSRLDGTENLQEIWITKLSNPYTLQGSPVRLSFPEYNWEKRPYGVNEGPAFLQKGNKLHIVYSASQCHFEDYCLGLLTANIESDFLNPVSWSKYPKPVFQKSPENNAYAVGHHSCVQTPEGEWWLIYHGKYDHNKNTVEAPRDARMQRFYFNGDYPVFGVPVAADTPISCPESDDDICYSFLTYKNPVIHTESPDPGVYHDTNTGWYYVYNTFREAFRSKDLVSWNPLGNVLNIPGNHETTWAPHVSKREKDGLIYMFYTQDARLHIAKSSSPEGPFEHHAGPLLDYWSIDSHFFQDDDGKEYIYWNTGGCDASSGIWVGELNENLTEILDPQHCLGETTHPEEWITECVREAPFMLKHKGIYYLIYSGNGTGANYGLGYATSHSPRGPWNLHPGNPLIWDGTTGPGHCSFTWSPDGNQMLVFYHQSHNGIRCTSVDKAHFIENGSDPDILEIQFTNKALQAFPFCENFIQEDDDCTEPRSPFKEHIIPGVIEIEDFDNGCPGDAYFDTTETNQGGEYRDTHVDIEVCGDIGGGYNVGWISPGEWLEYTVEVAYSDTFLFDFRIASGTDHNMFHLKVNGEQATPIIELPNTGQGLQTYHSYYEKVFLESGTNILQIYFDNATGGFNFNKMTISSSEIIWNFHTDLEGWTLTNNLAGGVTDSILLLEILGSDPFMHSPDGLNINAATHSRIKIGMKNNTSGEEGRIYFVSNTNPGYNQDMSVPFSTIPNDEGFTEYTITMSQNPGWDGTITQLRLDPLDDVSSGSIEIDYIMVVHAGCEPQAITFESPGVIDINDPYFILSAVSSSGLPVTYSVQSGPVTINGDTLFIQGAAGLATITAYQHGNDVFCPATPINMVLRIADPSLPSNTVQIQAYGDQWTATDGAGRRLPTYDECGDYRPDRYIGMFYWIWHSSIRLKQGELETVPELLQIDPDSPPFECNDYYWSEPESGFYHPSDPWSTRRNLQMLANAGIDFIFFDFTNGDQGCNSLHDFMAVALEMQEAGIPVPKISFFMNENYHAAMSCVINNIYNNPEYNSLLFYWQGKPLLMADTVKCAAQTDLCRNAAILDMFTWRKTWAFDQGQWNFLDLYPQNYYVLDGEPEQMPVCKAQGAPLGDFTNKGSSFHKGKSPEYDEYWETDLSQYGFAFEEHWKRAHEVDPKIVCITGWNEFTAAAWPTHPDHSNVDFMGKKWNDPSWRCVNPATCLSRNPDGSHKWPHGWLFVDQFNLEFNRDLEPIKGGFTDNYYYQLVSNVRRFKGMAPPEPLSEPREIILTNGFDQWADVTPVYKDAPGDVMNRNFKNVNNSAILTNNTARNDIIESRTTYDADSIYFYVKTLDAITPHTGQKWMLLFLDVDRQNGTGWEGYDFLINHEVISENTTTLKKWNGATWTNALEVPYRKEDNEMHIAVPRSAVLMANDTPEFYFKWADNIQHLNDVTAFFTDGEAAPDRRFNYNYSTSAIAILPQTPFTEHHIPGTIQFEDFDNGGVGVAYADATIGNAGGKYRPDESVDIGEKSESEYYVGWVYTGEWLEYTVNTHAIGIFTLSVHYTATDENNRATVFVNNIDKTGIINFPSTGTHDNWSTKEIDIRLTAGQHILRFYVNSAFGEWNLDKIVFTEKDVVFPSDGTGLWMSLWTAAAGGRNWFIDSICGDITPFIDKAWGHQSPGCDIPDDFWNARWEGQIEPLYSEDYTFYVTVKDQARLWINNQLIIDAWVGASSGQTHTGSIQLTAGEKVNIRLDYAKRTGDSYVRMEWESENNTREIVPQSQLFPIIATNLGLQPGHGNHISIFPNPTRFNLTIDTDNQTVYRTTIFDDSGRIVYADEQRFTGVRIINTQDFERGIYFLKMNTHNNELIRKIIIH